MRAAILRIAEERTGVKHELETGEHVTLIGEGTNSSQYILCWGLELNLNIDNSIQATTSAAGALLN